MVPQDILSHVLSFQGQNAALYAYDEHFGLVNFFVANTTLMLQVNKLRPSTTYNFSAFCYNNDRKHLCWNDRTILDTAE